MTDSDRRATFRALRFALACVVLIFAYPNIRGAILIEKYRAVRQDMLPAEPMGWFLAMLVAARPAILAVAVGLPLVSIVSFKVRSDARAFYLIGILVLASAALGIVLLTGFVSAFGDLMVNIGAGVKP